MFKIINIFTKCAKLKEKVYKLLTKHHLNTGKINLEMFAKFGFLITVLGQMTAVLLRHGSTLQKRCVVS